MSIPVFVIDAFTDKAFSGNPAAVCCLQEDLPDDVKQKIAAEMNLSETVFVTLSSATDSFSESCSFGLRWFTPTNEVPLCGHATLASAAVLFREHKNRNNVIEFKTLSGVLRSSVSADGLITLDFPINSPEPFQDDVQRLITLTTNQLKIKDVQLSITAKKLLVRLDDNYLRSDLEKLEPDIQNMENVESSGKIKGVIVTVKAQAGDGYDFYSRYFAPWNGIPEDPVTGSAHTVLAPYWAKILGKTEFKARQCSKRGGDLLVRMDDNRVFLTGQAVKVLEGSIHIKQ